MVRPAALVVRGWRNRRMVVMSSVRAGMGDDVALELRILDLLMVFNDLPWLAFMLFDN